MTREEVQAKFRVLLNDCASADVPLSEVRRAVLSAYILTVLRQERGNQSKAARRLGRHRNTLARDIAELELTADVERIKDADGRGKR